MIVIGKNTNIETQNNKKDSQQDTRIDSLQSAVDSLNAQVSAINASIQAINASIDDKYSAQTQTLMSALTSQINALSSSLSSVVSTVQVSANIGNFERLAATISANIEQLTALTGNINALTSEQINAQSVEISDSVVTDELQAERATITEAILTRVAIETFTITNLVAELLKSSQIESEIIKADEVQSGVVKAVNLTGKGWQTPIGTPDNTELLKITIPLYEGVVQVITEGNEFNVSILNNVFVSWTEKSAYLYRIQLTETAIELYLQNIGDTVNYQLLFIGSTDTKISTSEIVDKTGIKQNILTFSGYLNTSPNGSGVGAQIVIVDVIPEEGEEGVIYFSPVLGAWTFNPNSGETGAMNALSGTELLNAVNANTTHIGNISTLLTEAKNNLVSAINELYNAIDMVADDVDDLQSDVTDLQTDVGTLQSDVTDLQTDVGTLQSDVTDLQTDVGTLQNDVTDLQTDVGTLQNDVDDIEADIATINGNDTGLSMREVAQDVAAGVYIPQGSCLFADLPSLSSTDVKVGYVYDILDDFTTTSDFREGAGIAVPAGTNIVVIDVNGVKKWDLLGFNIDLSPYQKKILTAPVMVGGTQKTTVEDAITALAESESGGSDKGSLPVGSYLTMEDNSVAPQGYLLADGRDTTGTDDELLTKYPLLYAYLGNTNVLPTEYGLQDSPIEYISTELADKTASDPYIVPHDGTIYIVSTSVEDAAFRANLNGNWVGSVYGWGYLTGVEGGLTINVKKGDVLYIYDATTGRIGTPEASTGVIDKNRWYASAVWKKPIYKYIKAVSGIETGSTEAQEVVDAITNATSSLEQDIQDNIGTYATDAVNAIVNDKTVLAEAANTYTHAVLVNTQLADSLLNYEEIWFYARRSDSATTEYLPVMKFTHEQIVDCLTNTGTYSIILPGYGSEYREMKFNSTGDVCTAVSGAECAYKVIGYRKRS